MKLEAVLQKQSKGELFFMQRNKEKKICVATATRAEYGLLRPLILRIMACAEWELQLAVTGTHLAKEFGNTYREIEEDHIPIFRKIPILESGDDAYAVSVMMANALCGFGKYFKEQKPDLLILLGDRTETLAIAAAAMNARIPIAHLHGGELTQGAVDDCVRHAITKMSYLHFPSTEEYRRRIIQMGEEPGRVFQVGALGVENIMKEHTFSRPELEDLGVVPKGREYAVVTFHPVTLEGTDGEEQIWELLAAMGGKAGIFFLITKANADAGGRRINEILARETAKHDNMKLVDSLGMKRYLSAVKYARFVLGNSSSGIIEAPVLGVPTVNIGDRQKGRLQTESIINCSPEREAIGKAMERALQMDRTKVRSPYGDGTASEQIVAVLKNYLNGENIQLKKPFYDIRWSE